ncbi:PEP-CTERM sorting domain-containing protein [Almyronema epifaneia]|uniref:PEP-CTERM sorting domain-containing protein n=1 Tax=Almyronema epifaneia S1 TaxID=2991925 RepID=A0ABW6IF66_9CYAN
MSPSKIAVLVTGAVLASGLNVAMVEAAIITFDDLVEDETSFGFDGDGDGIDDVIFSTTDVLGFRTVGPGLNQNFVEEPGLEGTSLLNPDLRVEFLNGAVDSIRFGFALNSLTEGPATFASFSLFNAADSLLASTQVSGLFTDTALGSSNFPEGEMAVSFSGTAAYGEFNFSSDFGRFIIDNFAGTFGSTEPIASVPEPLGLSGFLIFAGLAIGLKRFG